MATKKNATKTSQRKKTDTTKKPDLKRVVQPNRKLRSKEDNRAYSSFRFAKKIKHPSSIPKARIIFVQSYRFLRSNLGLFSGIFAIFFVLSFVFVRGIGGGVDVLELEVLFSELLEDGGRLVSSAAILTFLASSVTTASTEVGSMYQAILFVIVSLTVIYATRLRVADNAATVKQSFYEGTYPLIPFILVLSVIGLQLLPMLFGSWLFNAGIGNALAINPVEQFAFATIFFLLTVLSLYMVSSSIFALYIVTLPKMTPLKALRSARELVRYRRWSVIRKLFFLPVALVLVGGIVLFPVVLLLTPLAEALVLAYTLFATIFVHIYIYTMYRELL